MKKKTTQIIGTIFLLGLFVLNLFPTIVFAASRDCDGNALIYCGTLSKSELTSKLNNGTGKENQSSAELKALFGRFGFDMADINQLRDGRVTRSNTVYVGNTAVAHNVYTFGRHNISGSTRVDDISYPIYRRHPSVSFLSSSIDAFVYTNFDGSMAYAILKSCGNIVQGVGKRTPPPETLTKVSINILKFDDANRNALQDESEVALSGWQFRVSGAGVLQTVTTDNEGRASINDLPEGIYVVTEVGKPGWTSTTGLTKSQLVNANATTQQFVFGNVKDTTPPGPGGETLVLPIALPSSGLAENIAILVAGIMAVVLLAYFGTRVYLARTLRGYHSPTDPRKLIKELRKRTAERKNGPKVDSPD